MSYFRPFFSLFSILLIWDDLMDTQITTTVEISIQTITTAKISRIFVIIRASLRLLNGGENLDGDSLQNITEN